MLQHAGLPRLNARSVFYPLLNVFQLLFLAGWSALWITVALLVAVVTRNQEVALRMARRLWAPGCDGCPAPASSSSRFPTSTGRARTSS